MSTYHTNAVTYGIFLSGSAAVAQLSEVAHAGISNLHNPLNHEAALCVCTAESIHMVQSSDVHMDTSLDVHLDGLKVRPMSDAWKQPKCSK